MEVHEKSLTIVYIYFLKNLFSTTVSEMMRCCSDMLEVIGHWTGSLVFFSVSSVSSSYSDGPLTQSTVQGPSLQWKPLYFLFVCVLHKALELYSAKKRL